eukprot:CAMPEP_0202034056 /NCGR_PEP_ID=MMETSP0905-20130828/66359_1 /ASSEMBLY_ACC=CAM_ASM_000554 /TAXON_ID=420261 /ORGANISM="Thalassiosira antarctica, Strain CCMP982" /LENGTH=201 /DNA_ID=CAMNT_0048597973 /DNA_START=718 /DNA_END=1321 /DNA_ORIENTATION=+
MSSFGITPTYRPSTHHHTPPVSEHEINQFRIEKGQCPKCGLQTHKLRSSLIRGKKSIPLTNDNVLSGGASTAIRCERLHRQQQLLPPIPLTNDNVLSGRCLDCNPMRTTSPAATAAPPSQAALDGDCVGYVGERNANGLRCGRGKMTWKNGDVYEGEWKADKIDGQGTHWDVNGDRYTGEWKADAIDGQGTYWYANGNRYE